MPSGNFVAYYRVSTGRQGRSGLGLDAQRRSVTDYLNGGGWQMVQEFTEVESGKHSDRPELTRALAACRKHKAKLVIAKLDRLARNVHFISGLMESRVDFVAADMPEANKLTVHIIAAMAEHERELISLRTRAALKEAKARGKRLGSPDPSKGAALGLPKARAARRAKADHFATSVLPRLRELQADRVKTLNGLARALNEEGIPTARGGTWGAQTVANVLARAEANRKVRRAL